MVVKSATKKKLMDLGVEEEYAHKLADDKKWDDVKVLSTGEIAQICGIDSGTSQRIHEIMSNSIKSSRASADKSEKTVVRRRKSTRSRRAKSMPLEDYDKSAKLESIMRDIDKEDELFIKISSASEKANADLTPRMISDLALGLQARGEKKITDAKAKKLVEEAVEPVSYTHLTLPTKA